MHFIGIGLQQIAEALVEPARFIGQHEHRAEMERGGPRRSIFVDKAKHLLVETNRHSAPFRRGRDGFAATADTGACNGLADRAGKRPVSLVVQESSERLDRQQILRIASLAEQENLVVSRFRNPWTSVQSMDGDCMAIEKRSDEHTSELQSLMRTSYAVGIFEKNIRRERVEHNL